MKIRTTRLAAMGVALALLPLGLTACSAGASSSDSNTLTVVSWKGEGTNVGGMPAINKAFEKAYPKIKLDFKYVDSASYDTYNNPRLAGGNAADVLMLDRAHMLSWSKQGFLADLSSQPWVSRLDPSLKPFNQVDGKTYQFTAESVPIGLYANTDLLKRAGINSVPTTWNGFLADLKELKSKNLGGFIVPNKGAWMGEQLSLLLAAQHVDSDWPAQYDAGKATFDPSWKPVVDQIKQLFSTGVVDPQLSLGLDPNVDGIPQFEAGKWAFMVQGSWALGAVTSASKFPVTMNAFPGGDTAKAFNFVGSGWGINAKAKNKSAAETYVNFLTKPSTAKIFLTAENAFSTLTDVPSPSSEAFAPISASEKAGDIVPSFAEALNAPDAETGIQKGIENIFANPKAPASDTITMLNSLVKPTALN
jgi:raffinose/stachyose/melibiose transport system substrate-binding protein